MRAALKYRKGLKVAAEKQAPGGAAPKKQKLKKENRNCAPQPRPEVYSLLHPLSLAGGKFEDKHGEAEVKACCERAPRRFAVSSAARYHSLVCVSSQRGSGLEEDRKILLQNNTDGFSSLTPAELLLWLKPAREAAFSPLFTASS